MDSTPYTVRPARQQELAAIQAVEVSAAQRFASVGLGFIARGEPLPLERLLEYQAAQGLHVVVTDADAVVGMAAHTVLDGLGYLAEVDVVPEHAGHRLGLRLLARVEACLRQATAPALWLTTYRDVPWNGPYYLKAGFREAAPPPGSAIAQRLDEERASPLGARTRIAMVKEL